MKETQITTIRFSREQLAELRRYAHTQELSVSAVVRLSVRHFLGVGNTLLYHEKERQEADREDASRESL